MPLLAALIELVLPRRCIGCGCPGRGYFCPGCRPIPTLVHTQVGELPVVAAVAYHGAARAALLAYKERGRRDLAAPLGKLLARSVAAVAAPERAPPGRLVLVPVPSARSVAAARGGDHVLRLARRAASATGLRVAAGALVLSRGVRDSAGLDIRQRQANLSGALAARPPASGLVAVLVDDIVTSGATLREAARALDQAGWPVAGAAVVAATERRFARRTADIGSAQAGGLA